MPSGSAPIPLPVSEDPVPDYSFKCRATKKVLDKPHVCRYCNGKRKLEYPDCKAAKTKPSGQVFAAQMGYIMDDLKIEYK